VLTPIRPQPAEQPSPFWWLRWVPAAILTVLVLHLLYTVGRVAIVPVLASFAVAYLLNPLVVRGEERGLSRPIATFVAILLVSLAAIALLVFVIPDIWEELAGAAKKVASSLTAENAAHYRARLQHYSPMLDRMVGDRLEQFLRDPSNVIGNPTAWIAGGLSGFFSTALASLDLLLVPFFVFYILVDFNGWRDASEDLIPPRFRGPFSRLFDEVGRILASYVRGQLLIAIVMAVLYAIGFAVLGVPAWAGIAVLSGLLNTIPYVGTLLGLLLATGFTLVAGGGFWRVGGVVAVFMIVQSIEGYYLTPRMLGARLSLHPMAVFLGLLIGGKLFGLLGVILAVPAIAVARVFLMFLRELYKGSYFYHAGDIHPAEAPSEVLEERLAEAAEAVLAEQAAADVGPEAAAAEKPERSPARTVEEDGRAASRL
jgi:predicted PurR-regulated permease PerM